MMAKRDKTKGIIAGIFALLIFPSLTMKAAMGVVSVIAIVALWLIAVCLIDLADEYIVSEMKTRMKG